MTDKTYSEDETMHLIAREVMKHRMEDLEKKLAAGELATAVGLAKIENHLGEVKIMIEKQSVKEDKSRGDLKKEIESDFASKTDFANLKKQIDDLVLKINWTIVLIIAAGGVIAWALSAANATKNLIGR